MYLANKSGQVLGFVGCLGSGAVYIANGGGAGVTTGGKGGDGGPGLVVIISW